MTKPSAITVIGAMTVLLVLIPALVLGLLEAQYSQRAPEMVMAVSSWPAARLAHSAEYFYYFDKHGLNVKIVDFGNDITSQKKAIQEGRADGAMLELADALSLAAAGQSVDIVMVTSHSNGAVGIVGSTSVKTLEELKGKRVAYEEGGSDELLLNEALSRVGLGLNDIISVKSSSAESVQMYLNNELDAVVVREPYLRQVLSKTNSRLMFSSRDVPGLLPDVLVFRSDYSEAHRPAVSAFVAGWLCRSLIYHRQSHNCIDCLNIIILHLLVFK